MAISTGFEDGWSPDKYNNPAPGRYHLVVTKALEDGEGRITDMIIDSEVLAGTTPGQEGTQFRDFFSKKMAAMGRIHQMATCCDLISKEELRKRLEDKNPPEYDFANKSVGRHFMAELLEEEYNGKSNLKSGFRLFHVSDPKVASWPKNTAMLEAAGYKLGKSADAKPAISDADMFNGVV
jgi:hypothetical protein